MKGYDRIKGERMNLPCTEKLAEAHDKRNLSGSATNKSELRSGLDQVKSQCGRPLSAFWKIGMSSRERHCRGQWSETTWEMNERSSRFLIAKELMNTPPQGQTEAKGEGRGKMDRSKDMSWGWPPTATRLGNNARMGMVSEQNRYDLTRLIKARSEPEQAWAHQVSLKWWILI